MARYRFGVGDYKYFADPLPPLVQALRTHAYPPLAAIANQFEAALDTATLHPTDLAGCWRSATAAGQTKPTPLLLHYEAGGYNCLHQDIYGDVVFPLQLTCFLSRRGVDYEGGDFLLVEQRPARAVTRRGDRHRAGRDRDLPHPPPAGAGRARLVPRRHAPRREPHAAADGATRSASSSTTRAEGR